MPNVVRPRPRPASGGPGPTRRRHRRHRRASAFGAWRRQWSARLPTGPILIVLAGASALLSLRAAPADLGLDPGATAPVLIATARLESGAIVGHGDVETRSLPLGSVPDDTVEDADGAVGRQVTATIFAGEPVAEGRLAPDGLVGVAAATPPGRSSFAVPADTGQPPVAAGQIVDLYALDSLDLAGHDPPTPADELAPGTGRGARRIARAAVVVHTDDDRVTVAVHPTEASDVAAALIGSHVVLAVAGPGTGP